MIELIYCKYKNTYHNFECSDEVYDELFLTRKIFCSHKKLKNGEYNNYHRLQCNYKNKTYGCGRLIYLKFKGEIPEGCSIDHKDRNTFNNKLDNLRIYTSSQQNQNQGGRVNNTTGLKNIHIKKDKRTKNKTHMYWCVELTTNGKKVRKGFKSKHEAIRYLAKEFPDRVEFNIEEELNKPDEIF